ncbi:MAG: glycosyltransferase [Lachnospiraceae bacterium]|nr:glycosyltransferase [Lachnospiraceae bacterium]
MEQKIRISQCMIVKNEENNIERALSWGKDIMWEQIVVDTGSEDRTAVIAEKMGAKLFHFDWIDDFSAAKNYAARQAGGDWIVFLDADEYLSEEDAKKLVSLLSGLSGQRENAVIASWIQTDGSERLLSGTGEDSFQNRLTVKADGSRGSALAGTVVRIFRNQPGLCYQGRIHEQLFLEGGEVLCFDASDTLTVWHTGYSPEEMAEKKKTERNIRLLKKEVEKRPDDYKMLSHLGGSYFQQGEYEEAARWYEKAVFHMPKVQKEESIHDAAVFKNLLLIYSKSEREDLLQKAYTEGVRRFPKEADYDYMAGRYYVGEKQFQKAAVHLQRAIGLLDQYGSDRKSTLLASGLLEAWEMLVLCCYENGDFKSCVNFAVMLLKAGPYRPETLKVLLKVFRDEEAQGKATAAKAPQVLAFLGKIYDLKCAQQGQFVLKAAQAVKYEELVRSILVEHSEG